MSATSRVNRYAKGASLALVLPLALAACGAGDAGTPKSAAGSGKGTISVWAHQGQTSEDVALQDAVKGFNASQNKITVKLKLIPQNDYTKTITATSASQLPDVLEMDGPTVANFVFDRKITPITPYVAPSTVSNATDAIKGEGTVNGKLYALGMYDSGLGLYANKKLLNAAHVSYPTSLSDDWTAAQFTAAVKKLAAVDPDHLSLDLQENTGFDNEGGTYDFSPILWSAGASLIKNGKAEGAIDSPAAVSALKTFASWKKYVDPNTDGNAFTQGRVALSWVGHWMYPSYSKALGSDLAVLPLPDFGNGPKTGEGSWTWGIGADTKNGKAAGAFMDYLLNDTNVGAMTAADGAPPATKTALAKSPLYKPGGPLALFAEQLAKPCGDTNITSSCVAVTRPVTAGYPVITAQFSSALAAIFNGADPKSALTKAAQAIDQNFSDNNGYKIP